jgi:hypothetical protein
VAFSMVERRAIEALLTAYCERRAPPSVRDKVRLQFRIKGESITLVESRPSFVDRTHWVDILIAKCRRNPETGEWALYCADRNSKWHLYEYLQPKKTLRPLLAEIDRDPTGIFWG